MPGADVPTASSDQFAPATKPMSPVRVRMWWSPSTQSSRPAASPTATTTPDSAASPGSSSARIMSITLASGWARRYSSSSALARSSGGSASAPTRLAERPAPRLPHERADIAHAAVDVVAGDELFVRALDQQARGLAARPRAEATTAMTWQAPIGVGERGLSVEVASRRRDPRDQAELRHASAS